MEEYLTISTAAQSKKCTRATVYEWLSKGILTEEKIGGKRFIRNDEKFQQIQVEKRGPARKDQIAEMRARIAELEKENEELKQKGGNKFTAVYKKTKDWWLGYVPEFPGAMTQGKTLEEARKNLKEALSLLMATYRDTFQTRFQEFGNEVIHEEL